MQVITDQVTVFSKDNKPCATAKPGEVLLFKTNGRMHARCSG